MIRRRPSSPEEKKARAERKAKLVELRNVEAPRAVAEYRAAEEAMRQKTARLRTERLARQAMTK